MAHQPLQRADHGFQCRRVGIRGDAQEVEVGPEGQFGPAVFAQRHQQEFLLRVELSQHLLQHRIGQQRKAGLHLLDVQVSKEFADGITHLLRFYVQPQPVGMALAGGAGGEVPGQGRRVLALAQHLRPQDLLGNLGMSGEQLEGKGAAVEQERQHPEELRIRGATVEELLACAITLGKARDPSQSRHRLGEFWQGFVEDVDQMLKPDDQFTVHLMPVVTTHEAA